MHEYFDEFNQREAEMALWLARRPKCCECKEPIQDDYLYEIDGNLYCEDCLKSEFRRDAENYER